MQRRLARLDTARKEFIANASHELRTPIFSLGGFVELLQDEELDEETRDGVPDHDARAGGPAAEADHRPARPLPARRRVAGAGARAGAAAHAREPGRGRVRGRRRAQGRDDRRRRPRRRASTSRRSATRSEWLRSCGCLVDNALVHTPDRNHRHDQRARPARGRRAPVAELLVADDGPGHPQARAGPRLRALPHERLGPGLGARARDRARARPPDGGTLEVASRPGSTVFTLTLPLAAEREQRPPARPAGSRSRREPSERRSGVLLCLSSRLLSGCGGDDSEDSGNGRPSSAPASRSSRGSAARTASTPPRSTSGCRPGVVTVTSLFGDQSLREILGGEGDAGQGSGFVLDGDGYIATNAHVVTRTAPAPTSTRRARSTSSSRTATRSRARSSATTRTRTSAW